MKKKHPTLQKQWEIRKEAQLAPVLQPEDLQWETFERIQALYEQALLQRAQGKLYVPEGAEELAPEDDEDVDGIDDSVQTRRGGAPGIPSSHDNDASGASKAAEV